MPRSYDELQAQVNVLLKASDEEIAAIYECELADAVDVRENHMENLEAERLDAGYPAFSFPTYF